ncbi:hypothetical protein Tco_1193096 [Tanacetum coccineum]
MLAGSDRARWHWLPLHIQHLYHHIWVSKPNTGTQDRLPTKASLMLLSPHTTTSFSHYPSTFHTIHLVIVRDLDIPSLSKPPRKEVAFVHDYTPNMRSGKREAQGIRDVDSGIRDTWVDPAEVVPEIAPMTMGEVNTRVVGLAELHERDTQDLYALLEDAQDSRMTLQETVWMVEEEAYASREAWAHSIGLGQATHQELQTHRDHVDRVGSALDETDRRLYRTDGRDLRMLKKDDRQVLSQAKSTKLEIDLGSEEIRTYAERQSDNKRKVIDSSETNMATKQHPSNRLNVAKVYTMGKGATSAKRIGTFAAIAGICTQDHFKVDCPKLKNKKSEDNGNAQGWVYQLGMQRRVGNAQGTPDAMSSMRNGEHEENLKAILELLKEESCSRKFSNVNFGFRSATNSGLLMGLSEDIVVYCDASQKAQGGVNAESSSCLPKDMGHYLYGTGKEKRCGRMREHKERIEPLGFEALRYDNWFGFLQTYTRKLRSKAEDNRDRVNEDVRRIDKKLTPIREPKANGVRTFWRQSCQGSLGKGGGRMIVSGAKLNRDHALEGQIHVADIAPVCEEPVEIMEPGDQTSEAEPVPWLRFAGTLGGGTEFSGEREDSFKQ